MFGYGYGRGQGGFGRGGWGRGVGPGRGACWAVYQQTGQWPAWSRWGGGPGYGRYTAMYGTPPAPAPQDAEIAALRQEVQSLRAEIESALQRLAEM